MTQNVVQDNRLGAPAVDSRERAQEPFDAPARLGVAFGSAAVLGDELESLRAHAPVEQLSLAGARAHRVDRDVLRDERRPGAQAAPVREPTRNDRADDALEGLLSEIVSLTVARTHEPEQDRVDDV